jgi:hypothetical protein
VCGFEGSHVDSHTRDAILRHRRLDERRAARLVAPVRQHEEEPRRVGRTQQLAHEERAVAVTPLRVVDPDEHLLAVSEAGEQLAQRLDSLAA